MRKAKVACVYLLMMIFAVPIMSIPVRAQEPLTFVMAYPSDIGELNPMFYRSERSHWYDMLVYDTLISYDDDLAPIPWLAEDWETPADGLSVTFTLREGATWHDGEAVTPEDVKFTFEHYKNAPEDAIAWSFMQHVTDVTIDGNDITATLDQPFAFALQTLGELYILPEHIHEGIAADDARWNDADNATAHTGSGPFMFHSRTEDEFTELHRFEDWWGPDNPYVGQLPNIEVVRIDVVLGQDARILAMRNGEADSERYEVFGPYVNTILNAPELQLVTGVVSQWDYVLGFNMSLPGLNDYDVRKAMALGTDRQQLVDIGRLGFGTPTNSTIPAEFYPDLYDSDGAFWEYDVDAANQLLDDAGYLDVDGDGIREFPGDADSELAWDLWVLSWDDISVATGTGIQIQMDALNISMNVVIKDDGPMYEGIYAEPRQFAVYEMSHGYGSVPDHVYWRMHSDNIIDWGDNCYGLDNATMDAALEDFLGATPATVEAAAREVQVLAQDHIPYIPLFLSDDTHALRAEWMNYTKPPGGPFTSYNPRTMVFMYDSTAGPTTTAPPPPGPDYVLIGGVAAVALVVGIILTYVFLRKK